ncbi:hypothetical protein IVB04_24380 [Bradyrhizobium sp. 169]|nr:hypothetical protein [Bradyrhizobium sp. 169]
MFLQAGFCDYYSLPRLRLLQLSPAISARSAVIISLSDLKRRIDNGELSPETALSQSFAAIEAHEENIGAFVCRVKGPRAANKRPLRGIAVGIKEIIDTSELPTEWARDL